MSMVCGLDLHRQLITFDAMDTVSGEVWRGRLWQPDRERVRRWLRDDVTRRADGRSVAIAVEGCTGWRYVVEEVTAAGFEAHVAEPAQPCGNRGLCAARGRFVTRHGPGDRWQLRAQFSTRIIGHFAARSGAVLGVLRSCVGSPSCMRL
jgi:hypothetical protein